MPDEKRLYDALPHAAVTVGLPSGLPALGSVYTA